MKTDPVERVAAAAAASDAAAPSAGAQLARRLISGFFGYASVGAGRALVPFILLPLLAQFLSKSELGTLYLIETLAQIAAPFVLGNIQGAISSEFFHLTARELRAYIGAALVAAGVALLLVSSAFLAWQSLGGYLWDVPAKLFLLAPLLASSRILGNVALGLMQMQQRMRPYAVLSLLMIVLDLSVTTVAVALLHWGLEGRLLGTLASQAIITLVSLVWLRRQGFLSLAGMRRFLSPVLRYVLPLVPHTLAGTMLGMSDRFLLSKFLGNSVLAVYGVAAQLSAGMMLVSMAVCQAWNPMLFRAYKEEGRNADARINPMLLKIQAFFAVTAVGVLVIGHLVLNLWMGPSFGDALRIMPWLLGGLFLQSCYMLYSSTFFYLGRTGLLSTVTVMGALLTVSLNLWSIPRFGILGAGYTACVSWGAVYLLTRYLHRRLRTTADR